MLLWVSTVWYNTLKITEGAIPLKNLFDKFINVSIDIIHRGIVIYRALKPAKPGKELDLSEFTLTFEEHFDGNSINSDIWNHYRQGVRKGGYWDENQAFVKDSNLIIRTEYKEDGKYMICFSQISTSALLGRTENSL